jgi:hypothetical protein
MLVRRSAIPSNSWAKSRTLWVRDSNLALPFLNIYLQPAIVGYVLKLAGVPVFSSTYPCACP